LALLLLLCAGCASGRQTVLEEEWAAVSLNGARIGYAHTLTARMPPPEERVVTSVFTELRIKRLGLTLSSRNTLEFTEDLQGRLLAAVSSADSFGSRVSSQLLVNGATARLITQTMGAPRERSIPWDEQVLGPWAQTRQIREAGLKEGAVVECKLFVPEVQRVSLNRLTLGGMEELTIDGRQLRLRKGTMTLDVLPDLPTELWLDEEGNVVKSVTNLLGRLETLRCTKKEALEAVLPAQMADVIQDFMIVSNRAIEEPRKVVTAKYRLEAPAGALGRLHLEDRRQKIEERNETGLLLRVTALGSAEAQAPLPDAKYLAASPYVQSDDPQLARTAMTVAGDAPSPAEKAQRLRRWVFLNVTKKDYGIGLASAKQVLLGREGDCTEHAVLLTALLRAAGIPARGAVGVVYWKGKFAYHMWTEAFLNDWTALDATLEQELVDATHIRFATADLDSGSIGDAILDMAQVMGKLSISAENDGTDAH
jgi:hypothetical protein